MNPRIGGGGREGEFYRGKRRREYPIASHTVHLHIRGAGGTGTHACFIIKLIYFSFPFVLGFAFPLALRLRRGTADNERTNEREKSEERRRAAAMAMAMAMAMAAMRAAASLGPGALSSNSKRFFFFSAPAPLSSTSRPAPAHRRLRAFPSSEQTLEELNPSVELLRKTAEAVGDFRKTPIYIVGMDCTAKRNIAKLLANSIIYRYLCSEELLEDVLGGKDALNAFRESDLNGYLEVETEGLKQLTSMGSLVLCCGDGAVMNSTNLGLLRHGVSIWINVPLELVVNDMLKTQATSDPDSFSEAMSRVRQRYDELKERYGVSDITVSVQNVASQLGYSSIDSVTLEDMVLEIVRQIERLIRAKSMMEAAGKPF